MEIWNFQQNKIIEKDVIGLLLNRIPPIEGYS